MKNLLKKENGFTLIELIIVVLVIGIISTIALMNASDYVKQARVNTILTNIAQVERNLLATRAETGYFAPSYPPNQQWASPIIYDINTHLTPKTLSDLKLYISASSDSVALSPGIVYIGIDFQSANIEMNDLYAAGTTTPLPGFVEGDFKSGYSRTSPTIHTIVYKVEYTN